jgi:glutamate N-acetyltransferase/amino-acid N-acetyltransferase
MDAKMMNAGICAPLGFKASGVACGIKESGELDLCVIAADRECAAAGAFTRNAFKAPPVIVTIAHLQKKGSLRAIVANSGNANACTGERGLKDAGSMAENAAGKLGIEPSMVAVASTGVIGSHLPMKKVGAGIVSAVEALSAEGSAAAARAIMTTDTYPKELAFDYGEFSLGGMAKGAGMIKPNMATMLAFLTTDAKVDQAHLSRALAAAVDASFNLINIDGCSSTNDTVLLLANGASGFEVNPADLEEALFQMCSSLAKMLVEDAEGATHCIKISVAGALDAAEAKEIATAVAESPLVKTAFFGGDPNWGRIVQALGAAEPGLDPGKVSVKIGGFAVCKMGEPSSVDAGSLQRVMAAKEIAVEIDLGRGEGRIEVLTCDLSYDYVKINAEYHT